MSNGNYHLGDIDVFGLIIASERGQLNLTTSFVSASVYESIFTPGMVCDIVVLDTNDQLGQLRLSGDELVYFTFGVKGRPNSKMRFHLERLSDLHDIGAQAGKMYTLNCVSEEAMYAKTNYVQKSYNMLCSQMVQDIHYNYLHSEKPIYVEETKGPQNILIPHKNPYQAIDLIRTRSVSTTDSSSLYLYFENRKDVKEQTFNFITLEGMFKQEPIKSFKQSDAINTSVLNRGDDNILSFKIPQQFSSVERIALGGPIRVTTFNPRTWEFESNDVVREDTLYLDGGRGTMNSDSFKNRFFNANIPPQSVIPIDTHSRPSSFIPESTPDLQTFLSTMLQNSVKIQVIGDSILTSGKIINCTFLNKNNLTTYKSPDKLMTGNFLITRIHHKIGMKTYRPRYTCVIECIKGRYEGGIA
jgi:hypothetical protein